MKKLLASLFILSILLTSCGGNKNSTTETSETAFFFTYKTAEFEIDAPQDWDTQTAFTSEFPGEIRVAFKNNNRESDFIANLTVIREDNSNQYSSFDFSQKKLQDHQDTLINFELISQEELQVPVGNDTSSSFLSTFRGKNSTSSPTLEFMQLSLAKGNKTWSATASYLPSEDEFTIEHLDTMLRSFTLK